MNKAEKMLIGEKFEEVILAIPEQGKPTYVLAQTVENFRKILKAL